MSDSLIFKVQPTLSLDSVETDLNNYDYTKAFTSYYEYRATIAASGGSPVDLNLPSPSSLPTNSCFIELIADDSISLTYNNGSSVTMEDIQYIAGEFKAHSFVASNSNSDSVEIIWRFYNPN